jgi:hypothetical protein
LARKTGRRVREDRATRVHEVAGIVNALRGEHGLRLAGTISAASELVTHMYKGEPPLCGETEGFPIRKSFARETARLLSREIELLAPVEKHFQKAEQMWYALCQKGIQQAYAQFGDYVDAALIMDAPEKLVVSHVAVGHPHVPYILKKSGSRQTIHHL